MKKILFKVKSFLVPLTPEWVHKGVYNFYYHLNSKDRFNNYIKIEQKKECESNLNLVITDNLKALGDFFVSLQVMFNIDKYVTNQKYVFFVNSAYKEIVKNWKFKNIDFIFSTTDFGSYYDETNYSDEQLISIVNKIACQIESYSKNWKNVFIVSNTVNLLHLSCLVKINYNKCFALKNYENKKNTKIYWQSLALPSVPLWIYFYHFWKTLKIQFWESKKEQEYYYFANMSFDMIKEQNEELNNKVFEFYKFGNTKVKNNSVGLMPYGSTIKKSLNLDFINFFLTELLKKDTEVIFLNKEKQKTDFLDSSYFNVVNKSGLTNSLNDLSREIKNTSLIVSTDTSAYHIANLYGIPTIVFVNNNVRLVDRHIKFWLDNNNIDNQIIIVDNKFFQTGNKWKNDKKSLDKIKKISIKVHRSKN